MDIKDNSNSTKYITNQFMTIVSNTEENGVQLYIHIFCVLSFLNPL